MEAILGLIATIVWIVAIVDVVRRQFPSSTTKIVWALIVIFTHIVGAIVYFIIGRPMGRLPGEPA